MDHDFLLIDGVLQRHDCIKEETNNPKTFF